MLENIHSPQDLKKLPVDALPALADEIRQELLAVVSRHGGHLASNLGVVELVLALHYVFDFADDALVFDTGHQCYVHKLLTGRRESFQRLRQADGCCGFPSRAESIYDCFGTGHSGTGISAALGFAAARDCVHSHRKVVTVLGDGALGCGSSFEGLNNISVTTKDFILILNDNKMSISPNVGAFSRCLSRVISTKSYNSFKTFCRSALLRIPFVGRRLKNWISHLEGATKYLLVPSAIFEELGLRYFGPLDGHDLRELIRTLQRLKHLRQPMLLHVLTTKGKGYPAAEQNPTRFHSTPPFNQSDTKPIKKNAGPTFSTALGQALTTLRADESRLLAITAGMPEGTGLLDFSRRFPESFYDVGIAEGHAVAFAAGLAAAGRRPVFAVYASFSQRAMDYVFHDVCLQKLPVLLCLDRAGVVQDGPTHHGIQDLAFWRTLPNLAVLQPCDGEELQAMLALALSCQYAVIMRYPAGSASALAVSHSDYAWGCAEVLRQGGRLALWAVGREVQTALAAADILAADGVDITVVNTRFVMPFDEALMRRQLDDGMCVVTLEDHNVTSGFGSIAREFFAGHAHGRLERLGWPNEILGWGSPAQLRERHGLTATAVADRLRQWL